MMNLLQRIHNSTDGETQKNLLSELEVIMKSDKYPYIVQFYGAIFSEVSRVSRVVYRRRVQGDCWICMELMDTSLDKLYKIVYEKLNEKLPEPIIGKIAVAVGCLAMFSLSNLMFTDGQRTCLPQGKVEDYTSRLEASLCFCFT